MGARTETTKINWLVFYVYIVAKEAAHHISSSEEEVLNNVHTSRYLFFVSCKFHFG